MLDGWRARLYSIALLVLVLTVTACGAQPSQSRPLPIPAIRTPAVVTPRANPPPLPSDLSLLTLVTKERGLAPSYMPSDLVLVPRAEVSSLDAQRLRQPAEQALEQMLAAAAREGVMMKVNSAFRSYDYQAEVFRSEVATYGCAQALRESALPGHSEHQLGLAVDLTGADVKWDLVDSFAQTPEGRWLATNAVTYGFVLSYPADKETITGYEYEPWHYRYVTSPFAAAIVASGKTPTEYLDALGKASSSLIVSSGPAPTAVGGQCPPV